jgi:hypothetical protein
MKDKIMQNGYFILVALTTSAFLYSADADNEVTHKYSWYHNHPKQREYSFDGPEDQFNRSFSRDTAKICALPTLNIGRFINNTKTKCFYAETLQFILMKDENNNSCVEAFAIANIPTSMSSDACAFIENRQRARTDDFKRNIITDDWVLEYHKKRASIQQNIERRNKFALISGGIGTLIILGGIVLLAVQLRASQAIEIPCLFGAAACFMGYVYNVKYGTQEAQELYKEQLRHDKAAVFFAKNKKDRERLIKGGLEYFTRNNGWKLDNPSDYIGVPTSVPTDLRIKQLEDLRLELQKKQQEL